MAHANLFITISRCIYPHSACLVQVSNATVYNPSARRFCVVNVEFTTRSKRLPEGYEVRTNGMHLERFQQCII